MPTFTISSGLISPYGIWKRVGHFCLTKTSMFFSQKSLLIIQRKMKRLRPQNKEVVIVSTFFNGIRPCVCVCVDFFGGNVKSVARFNEQSNRNGGPSARPPPPPSSSFLEPFLVSFYWRRSTFVFTRFQRFFFAYRSQVISIASAGVSSLVSASISDPIGDVINQVVILIDIRLLFSYAPNSYTSSNPLLCFLHSVVQSVHFHLVLLVSFSFHFVDARATQMNDSILTSFHRCSVVSKWNCGDSAMALLKSNCFHCNFRFHSCFPVLFGVVHCFDKLLRRFDDGIAQQHRRLTPLNDFPIFFGFIFVLFPFRGGFLRFGSAARYNDGPHNVIKCWKSTPVMEGTLGPRVGPAGAVNRCVNTQRSVWRRNKRIALTNPVIQ